MPVRFSPLPTPGDVGKSFDPRWKNHVPAGTYDFSVQLSDALAQNYEVPAKLPGLTVTPRASGGTASSRMPSTASPTDP